MVEHTSTTKDPRNVTHRSDYERVERTIGNVPLTFMPSDSLLLSTEVIDFKPKDIPSKRTSGEFDKMINLLESQ